MFINIFCSSQFLVPVVDNHMVIRPYVASVGSEWVAAGSLGLGSAVTNWESQHYIQDLDVEGKSQAAPLSVCKLTLDYVLVL